MKGKAILILLFVSTLSSCNSGYNVKVTIINKSGQDIKALTILYHQGSSAKRNEIGKLTNGNKINSGLNTKGEDVYKIEAILNNGDTLLSHPQYVEAGYKLTETVLQNEIKSELESLY